MTGSRDACRRAAERRDRHHHEARVAAPTRRPSRARARRARRRLALDQHVGVGEQRQRRRRASPVEVGDDAALGRVVVPPPQAALGPGHVVDERLERALRRPARRLDDDDVGAEVGEQLAGPGARARGSARHPEAVERAHQITPSSARRPISAGVRPSTSP